MTNIFDSFIQDNPLANPIRAKHYKVTDVKLDGRGNPDWDASIKVINNIKLLDSETPEERYSYMKKDYGLIEKDDIHVLVPSHIKLNEFKSEGVKDRFEIDGKMYEVQDHEEDRFFDMTYLKVYLRQMIGDSYD